jgi:hypothetical protein
LPNVAFMKFFARVQQVTDSPLQATSRNLTATEGAPFSAAVASFTDADPAGAPSDYAATIDWGDTHTSIGTVGYDSVHQVFTVTGSHTYAEEGGASIRVTIQDAGGASSAVVSTLDVADPSVQAVAQPVSASAANAFSGVVVATFTDPGGAESPSNYSATIAWGDNSSSTGTISGPDANGGFSVSGGHTYAQGGPYTVQVTVRHDQAANVTVSGTATVVNLVTTTTLASSANPASFAQALTLTATVTVNTPTGTVSFLDTTTGNSLWTATLQVSSNGSDQASVTTSVLTPGSHAIRATYNGAGIFLTSFSSLLTVTINQSILVLDPTAGGALNLSGSASIKVAGNVIVDSNSTSALQASGAPSITAAAIQVVGRVTKSGGPTFSPAPATGAAVVTDPLAALDGSTGPSTSGLTNYGPANIGGNRTQTLNPGIYSQITVSGSATVTLNPGLYVIEGGGLAVSGAATLKGSGVTIYNASSNYPSTGGAFGAITVSGSGSVNLTPPAMATYAGVVIVQPAANTKALSLSGAAVALTGTLLAPKAQLVLSGSAQLNAALVVDTLTISGAAVANNLTLDAPAGRVAYTPEQVRTAYGISNLSLDGTGQTIALVDAYDNPSIYQALDAFDTQFGLTGSGPRLYDQYGPASSFLTVLNQDGQATSLPSADPNGPGTANWEGEEALDVEWARAIAPGAQVLLVEANSQSLADLMAAVATAAHQPGVSVVSMSWGFTEGAAALAADEALYDGIFSTPGVTFVASTGDYGSANPEYPAFSPNVVAVGGTSLRLNADHSYNSETGWGYCDNSLGTLIGSGGGLSKYEPEPAYQQGVQSTGARSTPDVSLVADPNTGAWIADPYNLADGNPFEVVGGTSLTAPSWAGLIALADQGRVAAGLPALSSDGGTAVQQALCGGTAHRQMAVELARRACEVSGWEDPGCLTTLAAACAEAGDLDEALVFARQALAEDQAARRAELERYERQKGRG